MTRTLASIIVLAAVSLVPLAQLVRWEAAATASLPHQRHESPRELLNELRQLLRAVGGWFELRVRRRGGPVASPPPSRSAPQCAERARRVPRLERRWAACGPDSTLVATWVRVPADHVF
jgi:hypothetical protein